MLCVNKKWLISASIKNYTNRLVLFKNIMYKYLHKIYKTLVVTGTYNVRFFRYKTFNIYLFLQEKNKADTIRADFKNAR